MLSLFNQTFSKQTAFNQTLPQKFAKKTLRAILVVCIVGNNDAIANVNG